MNARKTMKLMEKYTNCMSCGSDRIGAGAGALIVEDGTFKRSCKCGWGITVDENDEPVPNLKIKAWAKIGSRKIYEVHDNDGFFGYVSVNELQHMGYVNRVDHCKKAEAFFNTAEGREWVKKTRFFKVVI